VSNLSGNRESKDCFLAKRFARFQAMKAIDQDEPVSIAANKNWGLLPDLQHALGDFADDVRIGPASLLGWDIDSGNGEALAPKHWFYRALKKANLAYTANTILSSPNIALAGE